MRAIDSCALRTSPTRLGTLFLNTRCLINCIEASTRPEGLLTGSKEEDHHPTAPHSKPAVHARCSFKQQLLLLSQQRNSMLCS
jgi:hypothetical protein